jgi:hypothetical protein
MWTSWSEERPQRDECPSSGAAASRARDPLASPSELLASPSELLAAAAAASAAAARRPPHAPGRAEPRVAPSTGDEWTVVGKKAGGGRKKSKKALSLQVGLPLCLPHCASHCVSHLPHCASLCAGGGGAERDAGGGLAC